MRVLQGMSLCVKGELGKTPRVYIERQEMPMKIEEN